MRIIAGILAVTVVLIGVAGYRWARDYGWGE